MVTNLEIKEYRPSGTSPKETEAKNCTDKLLSVLSPIIFEMLQWTKEKTSKGEVRLILGSSSGSTRFQILQDKSTITFFDSQSEQVVTNSVIPLSHSLIEELTIMILGKIKSVLERKLMDHKRKYSSATNTEILLKFKCASLSSLHVTDFDNTSINLNQYVLGDR